MSDFHRRLESADRQWQVDIFRRSNGTFGFRVFRWHVAEEPEGPHWCLQGGYSESVTATADDAEREARARVPGLASSSENLGEAKR
jgi:hypothetical protein